MTQSGPFPLHNTSTQVFQENLGSLLEPHDGLLADLIEKDGVVVKTVSVEIRRNKMQIELLVPFPIQSTSYLVNSVLVRQDKPLFLIRDIDILITPVSPDYTLSIPVSLQ